MDPAEEARRLRDEWAPYAQAGFLRLYTRPVPDVDRLQMRFFLVYPESADPELIVRARLWLKKWVSLMGQRVNSVSPAAED